MGRGQSGLASDDAPGRHAEGCSVPSHSAPAATAKLNRQGNKVILIRPARRISAERRRVQHKAIGPPVKGAQGGAPAQRAATRPRRQRRALRSRDDRQSRLREPCRLFYPLMFTFPLDPLPPKPRYTWTPTTHQSPHRPGRGGTKRLRRVACRARHSTSPSLTASPSRTDWTRTPQQWQLLPRSTCQRSGSRPMRGAGS